MTPLLSRTKVKISNNITSTIKLFCLLLVVNLSFNVNGQTTIKGVVRDSLTNERMSFVKVKFQGETKGVLTDSIGYFELKRVKHPNRGIRILGIIQRLGL